MKKHSPLLTTKASLRITSLAFSTTYDADNKSIVTFFINRATKNNPHKSTLYIPSALDGEN